MVTLGVADLERATIFYRDGLNLPVEGDFEGVTFFKLRGAWLSLFPRDELTKDAGASTCTGIFGGFTLAHNVASKDEVNAVIGQAEICGRDNSQSAARCVLGRLSRFLRRFGWLRVGSRVESASRFDVKIVRHSVTLRKISSTRGA